MYIDTDMTETTRESSLNCLNAIPSHLQEDLNGMLSNVLNDLNLNNPDRPSGLSQIMHSHANINFAANIM